VADSYATVTAASGASSANKSGSAKAICATRTGLMIAIAIHVPRSGVNPRTFLPFLRSGSMQPSPCHLRFCLRDNSSLQQLSVRSAAKERVVCDGNQLASHRGTILTVPERALPRATLEAKARRLVASPRSVVTQPACFLVPTSAVPVSPQVGGLLWHDDDVAHARLDGASASGTDIGLDGLVRLYWMNYLTIWPGRFGSGARTVERSLCRHGVMVRPLPGNRPTVARASTIAGCPVS